MKQYRFDYTTKIKSRMRNNLIRLGCLSLEIFFCSISLFRRYNLLFYRHLAHALAALFGLETHYMALNRGLDGT